MPKLVDQAISKVLTGIESDEFYKKVREDISTFISDKEDRCMIHPLDSKDVFVIEQDSDHLVLTIDPDSRWFPVVYALEHIEELSSCVRIHIRPVDLLSNNLTEETGIAGFFKSQRNTGIPDIKFLLNTGKAKANLCIFIPRKVSKAFVMYGQTGFNDQITKINASDIVVPLMPYKEWVNSTAGSVREGVEQATHVIKTL